MSEAQADTTATRSQQTAAPMPAGAGRHRGLQAASEDTQAPVLGRHRRPAQTPTS
ncbi:hypothetical protein [Streptomyces sp. XD-27]|uniref:hypothetical protein n=1 Tax=Streptomyces sp. XD-27 TaxID=3062779 RepID=UPI0026F41683|nr:hypothetical protein [Streptomyces sp. XD-27]WKX70072.1 hypothetical protein Q3Y56_09265 [Streptomyces sp. XD-27]